MPTKIGGGGKPQEYDPSNGRYGHGSAWIRQISQNSASQLAQLSRSQKRRLKLNAKAAQSSDPLLNVVYSRIQTWSPGCVVKINESFILSDGRRGEVDIETRHLVIEVKSGSGSHFSTQFAKEMCYAMQRKKCFVAFAPNMSYHRIREAARQGFHVVASIEELEKIVREKEGKTQ